MLDSTLGRAFGLYCGCKGAGYMTPTRGVFDPGAGARADLSRGRGRVSNVGDPNAAMSGMGLQRATAPAIVRPPPSMRGVGPIISRKNPLHRRLALACKVDQLALPGVKIILVV